MARRRLTRGSGGGHEGGGMMRWLLTYADLITLLMVFFVVMYAMSSADQKKFNALKNSLALALHNEGAGRSPVLEYSGTQPITAYKDGEAEQDIFEQIISKVKSNVDDPAKVVFFVDERGLTIRFLENVLFDSGQAAIRPDAAKLLTAVGTALKGQNKYIRIEGHADNLPIQTAQFPSNWELSAARAIAVTRYLIDRHGLDPRLLSSMGYGEYRPLHANTTDANRAKNRRVDIVVLRPEKSGGELVP